MRKLVVSLAVLGLVGVAPASAHKVDELKCRAKIVDVTFVEGSSWQPAHQRVDTVLRVKNVSDEKTAGYLRAGVFDLNSDSKFDDELLATDFLYDSKLKPGEVARQVASVDVAVGEDVEAIRVSHCHLEWLDD